MMSSNTLGNTDFNPINGAVPPPKGKATLPKADKIKLTQSQPDKFERATSPRKTTDDAETTATVTEPKKDVLPLVFSGLALAGTIGLGLFTLFKKPEEATKTAETLVDDVARKQIETLEETVATQAQELAEKASNADLTDVQNGIEQVVKKIVKAERAEIHSVVDRQIITNVKQVTEKITAVDNNVKVLEQKHETALDDIRHQSQTIRGLKEQLDQIPMIGGNIVVHPETEALFTAPQKLTQTKGKSIDNNPSSWTSELMQKISKFNAEARKGVEERETGVDVKELIKLAFNHLTLEGTSGNPGEMKALAKALELVNTNVADPYKKQLKNLAYALRAVSDIYEGKTTKEYVLSPLKEYIALSELQEKANGVLAFAKTNDVGKTKTAQSELMTWLENIFTKTKPEIFEMNTNGKKPLKTLPAPHSDSDWVRDQKLLEGDKPLAELTQTLLGKGFKAGADAENPNTLTDVAILSDAIGALKKALVEEQNYTLDEWDMLKPPADGFISSLAYKVNRIAKTLISIDDKAIEGGLVPLRVVEGNVKNLDLPTQLWNARLNNDEDGVKAVTAQMFKELRSALFKQYELHFLPKNTPVSLEVAAIFEQMGKVNNIDSFTDLASQAGEEGFNITAQAVINTLLNDLNQCGGDIGTLSLSGGYLGPLVGKVEDDLSYNNFITIVNNINCIIQNDQFPAREPRLSQNILNESYPEFIEKMQALIDAKTKSVEKVETAQTELMAFLKDKFYKPEAPAA